MRGDDNGDTREEDSSSEFSDLEPPPEFEKVLEDSGITHNASEPKESPGNGEAKDDFNDNENGESSRDQQSIEVEDDVEEGKIQKSKESSEIGEKGKRKPAKPSPLVHVGSTRDQETELNGSAESDETSSLSKRKLLIAGFCACLFFIVIVQAITIGLFVSQNNSSDKDTSFENDEERSPTLRPTTLVPSTTPTEGNVFESIANDGNSIRLNQVSFCDECTERVTVPDNYHLPWNDRTYVTEFEVNSNGRVNLHCWNFSNCATIDVVVMNLSPNVQGSIYILWEQENVQDEDRISTKQQQRRRNSLTVSFEDVMLFGFFDESPYRVNAQMKISEGEITICYGAGKIQNSWMRAGIYNYTGNYQNFRPATGLPFDKNGYGSTFPAETCQTFSDGGGCVQTANPTYDRYPHTPQPTITPTNYYRTPSPTDWFSRTSPPTITPTNYQTPSPTNWYPRTSLPTRPPTIGPMNYQTPSPTKWFARTAPPTITTDWFSRTSLPTISPTIGPMNYQTPSPTKWFARTAPPTITTDWFSRTSVPTIGPTSYQETPSPTNWYPRTSPPTIIPNHNHISGPNYGNDNALFDDDGYTYPGTSQPTITPNYHHISRPTDDAFDDDN
ncbi:unnamed protein product [Cylindrotheca closterium]|uniref:Uncharacterized protein n=1 Tax=Cylindrotheca closterium TaxID=2856 RepID=A0AAD2PU55_9STRA|nr:unnamed protein product [Cylindrotheca closterium]